MAERMGLASMTDLAYIFPEVSISKGLAFCSLEQRYSFFLSALAYISRLSLSLSTSRKLPPTNCYSIHHLNKYLAHYHALHCAVSTTIAQGCI